MAKVSTDRTMINSHLIEEGIIKQEYEGDRARIDLNKKVYTGKKTRVYVFNRKEFERLLGTSI
jgi:hypothetical protein